MAYVNGTLLGSRTTADLRSVTRTQNFFGCSRWWNYRDANFDEIKIHSRALSFQEILADYSYNKSYMVPI
jgi:hypothetical protein